MDMAKDVKIEADDLKKLMCNREPMRIKESQEFYNFWMAKEITIEEAKKIYPPHNNGLDDGRVQ